MRIAVFLDVDKTLTKDLIQQEYAKVFGCEPEYLALEAEFQSKRDSTKFGMELIRLFASQGFTEGKAPSHTSEAFPGYRGLEEVNGIHVHLNRALRNFLRGAKFHAARERPNQHGAAQ
jgi:hypothetical protein